MGYVGFAVPFAFAVAGLLNNQINSAWAKWVRPWTLIAWAFLSLGIALGSWWAYYELGWGGWWFWDPVENASFMPWLLGTALIHSIVVTQQKAIFKHWTVLLAIVTFGLSLVGTFLVRSGVLTSVHAFATDPARGVFILMFLAVVIGGALLVFTFYRPDAPEKSHGNPLSRESFLLTNSVLLSVATATVLLGTLYPLIIDALGLGKISVGAPYFNSVFIPLMAPLLVLIGLGQRALWTSDTFRRLSKAAKYPLLATITIALGSWGMIDDTSPIMALFGLVLGLWVIFSTLAGQLRHFQSRQELMSRYLGQSISHIGFAITVIGITLVSSYGLEKHLRMSEGETTKFGGYEFRFAGASAISGPNYNGTEAIFLIRSENKFEARLTPQKRNYHSGGQTMTEAGISPGLTRDIYIALGEKINDTDWSVRLNIKPFVRLIWLGAILMAFGAITALAFSGAKKISLQSQKSDQINSTTGI
jgi:cytochrome c-type biogenesis protein CcmF